MKCQTFIHALVWGAWLLLLSVCLGSGGYAPPAAAATAPQPPGALDPGDRMGSGRPQNYGMMQQDMGRMAGMMGEGGMMGGGRCDGMMGGEGVQGEQGPQAQYRGRTDGAGLFAENCAVCHPNGGNSMNPNSPVRGAPQLGSYDSFRTLVRQGLGPMPGFSSYRLSDAQLRKLYRYLRSAYGG
jgi:mono/diheme cytochrome c family protein